MFMDIDDSYFTMQYVQYGLMVLMTVIFPEIWSIYGN